MSNTMVYLSIAMTMFFRKAFKTEIFVVSHTMHKNNTDVLNSSLFFEITLDYRIKFETKLVDLDK